MTKFVARYESDGCSFKERPFTSTRSSCTKCSGDQISAWRMGPCFDGAWVVDTKSGATYEDPSSTGGLSLTPIAILFKTVKAPHEASRPDRLKNALESVLWMDLSEVPTEE